VSQLRELRCARWLHSHSNARERFRLYHRGGSSTRGGACDLRYKSAGDCHAGSKWRIQPKASLETFLAEVEVRFIIFPITGQVCVRAVSLPATYPSDPADRIIGSTALVEGIPLVTADTDIPRSKAISTIW
jgi:hypothetical protein